MRGVANDPVRVGGSVTLSELEVTAPQGVAEIPAPLAVNQPGIEPAAAALPSFRATVEQAACGGHGDIGDHHRSHGGPGLHVLPHLPAPPPSPHPPLPPPPPLLPAPPSP